MTTGASELSDQSPEPKMTDKKEKRPSASQSPVKKREMKIEQEQVRKQAIVVGKQRTLGPDELDLEERAQLQTDIKNQIQMYQKQVNKKYHDRFEASILMDSENVRCKNEITRKVKVEKMKKTLLPDFIRVRKQSIIDAREEQLKQIYQSQMNHEREKRELEEREAERLRVE